MNSDGLWEMFEGDFADIYAGKFYLVSMGGWAEGPACADPGARTPLALAEIVYSSHQISFIILLICVSLPSHYHSVFVYIV